MSNELTNKERTDIAIYNYGDDEGGGFQNQGREDLQMPMLLVLQPMSPQIAEEKPGAQPGAIYHTVTEESFPGKTGISIVPATTKRCYIEFGDREEGGGFKARHEPLSDVVVNALKASPSAYGNVPLENGNHLVETFELYCVIVGANGPEGWAVMALSGSKIKEYKKWNSKLRMFSITSPGGGKVVPPMYAHATRVTVEKRDNDKGFFYVPVFSPVSGDVKTSLLPPTDPGYKAARELAVFVNQSTEQAPF